MDPQEDSMLSQLADFFDPGEDNILSQALDLLEEYNVSDPNLGGECLLQMNCILQFTISDKNRL